MPTPLKNIESLSTKIGDLVDMLRSDRHSRLGITEVAAVTEVLVSTAGRYFSSLDTALYQEFNNLSEHLKQMHDEIAKVQVDKIKGEKQIQSLKLTNENLQEQLNDQKIENLSVQQQRDGIRLQLEQLNQVMETLGYKDKVYEELERILQKYNKVDDGE